MKQKLMLYKNYLTFKLFPLLAQPQGQRKNMCPLEALTLKEFNFTLQSCYILFWVDPSITNQCYRSEFFDSTGAIHLMQLEK